MDIVTDAKIKEVVETDLSDRTIIAVAHRICKSPLLAFVVLTLFPDSHHSSATIIDFDLILVLDDGRVAEFGPPKELLRDSSSRFSKLAATQGLVSARNTPKIGAASNVEESDIGVA